MHVVSISVILLMVSSAQLSLYMDQSKRLGYDSEYVFLHYYWMAGMKRPSELWNGPASGQWDNLILMNIKLPPEEQYMQFVQQSVWPHWAVIWYTWYLVMLMQVSQLITHSEFLYANVSCLSSETLISCCIAVET